MHSYLPLWRSHPSAPLLMAGVGAWPHQHLEESLTWTLEGQVQSHPHLHTQSCRVGTQVPVYCSLVLC